ncbi:FAD-dependent oxidoreductase [bacterium]|nr:FAD-dependent oxidoreductase [bacterium]
MVTRFSRRRLFSKVWKIGGGIAARSIFPILEQKNHPKVLIVGAGLAGLCAAYELSELGHEVVLFEAQNRAGGRVLTLRREFSDGLYAEAGAMFVSNTHSHVLNYCRKFNIPLVQYSSLRRPAYVVCFRGNRVKLKPDEPLSGPWNLNPDERKMSILQLWDRYALSKVPDQGNISEIIEQIADRYDRMTFSEFLAAQGASKAAISLLRLGYLDSYGEGIDSISAAQHLRSIALSLTSQQHYVIANGSEELVNAFSNRLPNKIRYNHELVQVEAPTEKVTVTTKHNNQFFKESGDYLIIAIPFSVLRSVRFDPPLRQQKRDAISMLKYTSVNRIFLECDSRFWLEDGVVGEADTDLKVMRVLEQPLTKRGKGAILEAFTTGKIARQLAELSSSDMKSTVVEDMEKVHPGLKKHLISFQSKDWDADPWAKGAFCWFSPGELKSIFPILGEIGGRILFAGEHTSQWSATMEGALESANRVVRELASYRSGIA